MTEKEFCLSDNIIEEFKGEIDDFPAFKEWMYVKDVKEFIKRLKDNSWDLTGKSSDYVEGYNEAFRVIAKKIDKLAGEKLVGGKEHD